MLEEIRSSIPLPVSAVPASQSDTMSLSPLQNRENVIKAGSPQTPSDGFLVPETPPRGLVVSPTVTLNADSPSTGLKLLSHLVRFWSCVLTLLR
jgi:hypothetical protein